MRTKGSKNKKKVASEVTASVPMAIVNEPTGTPIIAETGMSETGMFGNEDMHILINKVNEIVRFINK